MFKSTLRFATVGVLAALVLLVAAGPSQAQRGHASFRRGLAVSHAGGGGFHPGMAQIHRTTAANRRSTAAVHAGLRHVHPNGTQFNTLRMTTPQMVIPRMNTPQMVMPQLNRGI
jgi:hypothetical protein